MSFDKYTLELTKIWQTDLHKFVVDVFHASPTPQQKLILDALSKPSAKVAVKAGHGVGKTAVASWFSIWHCLFFDDSKTALTAPSSAQLKDVLCAEIGKWINKITIPDIRNCLEVNSMGAYVKGCEKTQFISARTARKEQPDALQGFHADHMAFVVDEAFGVHSNIYEVAKGSLTSEHSRCLLIGNPTVINGYAFECFHKNKRHWQTFTLSCLDSHLVSNDYYDEMLETYGKDSDVYKIRVLGEFPNASITQFIPLDVVNNAFGRHIREHEFDFAPVVIACDPAWFGSDKTTIYLRQGLMSKKLWECRQKDSQTIAGQIAEFEDQYNSDATFIDAGMGNGIIDCLRGWKRKPIPVYFASSSTSPMYANKRAQMWGDMKTWLKEGCIPPDNDLKDDLVAPEYHHNLKGQILLEKKEDMRKRGLHSPDDADALALTFAFPVAKKSDRNNYRNRKLNKSKNKPATFNSLTNKRKAS